MAKAIHNDRAKYSLLINITFIACIVVPGFICFWRKREDENTEIQNRGVSYY